MFVTGVLVVLALTLGAAAVSILGSTGIAVKDEVALPCYTAEWVKDLVAENTLGDCLDSGGILFGRPGVEPLGDPIDGGGILFKRSGAADGRVEPLGDPIDGGILF